MNFRHLFPILMILGFSHAAQAALFRGNCEVGYGSAQQVAWEADFDSRNSQSVKQVRSLGGLNVELTISPGAAAFADVMIVKVQTQKSEFELMSLLSSVGYGSIVYSGSVDGQKLLLECTVNKVRN